jgi:hypothetical protein
MSAQIKSLQQSHSQLEGKLKQAMDDKASLQDQLDKFAAYLKVISKRITPEVLMIPLSSYEVILRPNTSNL